MNRPVSSASETSSVLTTRCKDGSYFIIRHLSTKYAPAIGCEQQNTHKQYVQDMTKILRQKMFNISGAHRFNGNNICHT